MGKQKVFWATNIQKLRARKNLSQEQLAESLGISRAKLGTLEIGKTINPPIEDLLNFSTFFKISVDTLLKVDLRKVSELKIRELESGNDSYVTGTKIRVHATTIDSNNNENAEYVPHKAKAGYTGGYADPEYIAALPKFSLPHLSQQRKYRMFPITGDSMLPIPDKSLIVAEYVEDWVQIKDDTLCIVILKNAGPDFVFKQVNNRIKSHRSLTLKSLNVEYTPYEVQVGDVLEIWKYAGFFSETVPGGTITMGQIANALQGINVSMSRLADKIN